MKENTPPDFMTTPFRRVRFKWHFMALRVVVMTPVWVVYRASDRLSQMTEKLFEVLKEELPDPKIEEWVPFEQLSKKRQREIHQMNGTLDERYW